MPKNRKGFVGKTWLLINGKIPYLRIKKPGFCLTFVINLINKRGGTMKFKLEFSLDNEAFKNEDESINLNAVAEALKETAEQINQGADEIGYVRDNNGNKVGEWDFIHAI